MNKREVGTTYEQVAVDYLARNGVKILEKNYRCRQGEIDIVGRHGEYLVFFEVKYRKDEKKGMPQEAVSYSKQKTICKVADYYRMIHKIGEFTAIRYDVVAICGEQLTWYQNAFAHIYK